MRLPVVWLRGWQLVRAWMLRFWERGLLALLPAALFTGCVSPQAPRGFAEVAPGLCYTNQRNSYVPWSIYVVRVDRAAPDLELHSVHAHARALGLSTLGEMVDAWEQALGTPVVAVNGDFYQMSHKGHPGDPRGLQIVDGALVSAPSGGACFLIDPAGQPQTMNVTPRFKVFWPNGTNTPLGLNETRKTNGVVLFTPDAGWSTLTRNSRELVLEREDGGPWPPLRAGETFTARVREVRDTGNTPLGPDVMVLSIHRRWSPKVPKVTPGAVLRFSLETSPDMRGIPTALGGGPVLVRGGERQSWPKVKKSKKGKPPPPEIRTMWERHPRTALGWNDHYYFLVAVDGRQQHYSVGMTLNELAQYMINLGCREAINLDGGGSSTLWLLDGVVNSPSDEEERAVSNALFLVRKKPANSSPPAE
jgi:hypothetical protein